MRVALRTALLCALSLVSAADYSCLEGFDCSARNSCPSLATPCPPGWFCGSFLGHPQQALLDKAWAVSQKDNGATGAISPPPDRFTEARCFKGWFCPNTTTILRCPANSWCMEGVVAPEPCDLPAACAAGAAFQISFALPIIFVAVSVALATVSALLVLAQARAEAVSRAQQASGGSVSAAAPAPASAADDRFCGGLDFEFDSVALSLGGRAILAGVSGRAPAATVTAFMGPSGSGKTSLMNALRGSLPANAALSGAVRVFSNNGDGGRVPVPAAQLPTLLGFVAQDDTMDRSLTVRELLSFSARARLPRGTPRKVIDAIVASTLRDLSLEGVADVVVGGGENAAANISGGQLKRTSIGIELVARPRALFLDEPTSGLDATAALDLMRALRRICERQRIAVVCVLHQPRAEAFLCVSRLLLLAQGGRVAYEGPASGCVPHFLTELRNAQSPQTTGVASAVVDALPKGTNPADWIIDLLLGWGKGSASFDLAAAWASSAAGRAVPLEECAAPAATGEFSLPAPPPGFAAQALLSVERTLLTRLRDWRSLRFFLLLHMFMAVSLSPGFSPLIQGRYNFEGPNPAAFRPFVPPLVRPYASKGNIGDLALQQMCFFMTIACGSAGAFLSVALFGSVRAVLRREAAAGADLVAVGVGRMAADVVVLAWCALAFSAVWMLFGHAGHWWHWLGVIFACLFATSGVGQFVSLFTRPTNASVIVFLFIIVQSVFSGIEPRLRLVVGFPVVNLVWLLSVGTYVAQGVFSTYVEPFRATQDVDLGAADFGFDATPASIGAAVGTLVGLGLMWRAFELLVLWWQQASARGGTVRASATSPSLGRVGLTLLVAAAMPSARAADISSACATAAVAALGAAPLSAGACAGALAAAVASLGAFAACTDGGACVTDAYLAAAAAGNPNALYDAYSTLDANASAGSSKLGSVAAGAGCALCSGAAFTPADCAASAAQLVAVARNSTGVLDAACVGAGDALALTLLRDQVVTVCARSDARVLAKVPGSISSARYAQCVRCGVVKCSAGMFCARDAPPAPCPPGYFCADGIAPVSCPPGFFCPVGVAQPVACRALAAGTCAGSGSTREIVWVPLLIALLLSALARLLVGALEVRRAGRVAAGGRDSDADRVGVAVSATVGGGGGGGGALPSPKPAAPQFGVRLSFDSLSLSTRGVTRLDALTGAVRPGQVTAILGGSGAGKTTLMNVLLCKEAPTSGTVRVAATPLGAAAAAGASEVLFSATELRRALGFVPQTDVLLRDLSLRESVLHSALTRLPRTLSRPAAAERAEGVLEALGLSHVADSLVGDEATRGVSGGERKRLNIALELVADPLVLFLDEPTTGLDAAAALSVMESLRALARSRGIAVVAVVHQPRHEIVETVDELILLGRGGRPAYLGPRDLTLDYFTSVLGFELPDLCSPADFFLDVVNGKHGAPRSAPTVETVAAAAAGEDTGATTNVVAIVEALASVWRTRGEAWVQQRTAAGAGTGAPRALVADGSGAAAASWSAQLREQLGPRRSFLAQVQLHAARAARQRLRGSSLAIDLAAFLAGGCVIGIVLSGGDLLVPQAPLQYFFGCPPGSERYCMSSQRIMFAPATFYFTMIVGAQSIAPAVRLFGAEREVAWREAGVGVSTGAYFLGKLLVEVPVWCLLALNFTAPLVAIAPMRGPFSGFYALALTCVAVCSAIGAAISAWLGKNNDGANLAGIILATIFNLFGGFVPLIGRGAVWAYTHWTSRAFVAIELSDGYGLSEDFFKWTVGDEWDVPNWPRDLGILWLISVLTFLLAFAITVTLHRDKRR